MDDAGAIFRVKAEDHTVAKSARESFEENERPTAPRSRAIDPNVTARFKVEEIESLVRTESGTRAVVTPDQIDRYVRERADAVTEAPPPQNDSIRERETIDATTLERETLVIHPAAPAPALMQKIPIDVDLSRLAPIPRARPERRSLAIAIAIAIGLFVALAAALVGFLAGRASL